jgi:lycopene cyclase domain-containing protein
VSTYFLINIGILFFPLLLSFDRKVAFWRRSPAVLLSILTAGTLYVVWDIFATSLGKWSFAETHVLPYRFFGLPLEEVLFFVTAPYGCLFIYECIVAYFGDRSFPLDRKILLIPFVIFLAGSLLFRSQIYTATVLLFCASVFLLGFFVKKPFLLSRAFWIFILVSYLPFLLFNYLLTSIPVVRYSPLAIWNIRILTIPLEDFFYSFSMLAFFQFAYLQFREKFTIR